MFLRRGRQGALRPRETGWLQMTNWSRLCGDACSSRGIESPPWTAGAVESGAEQLEGAKVSETVSAEVARRLRQQLRAQRGGGQVQGGGGLSNLWDGY